MRQKYISCLIVTLCLLLNLLPHNLHAMQHHRKKRIYFCLSEDLQLYLNTFQLKYFTTFTDPVVFMFTHTHQQLYCIWPTPYNRMVEVDPFVQNIILFLPTMYGEKEFHISENDLEPKQPDAYNRIIYIISLGSEIKTSPVSDNFMYSYQSFFIDIDGTKKIPAYTQDKISLYTAATMAIEEADLAAAHTPLVLPITDTEPTGDIIDEYSLIPRHMDEEPSFPSIEKSSTSVDILAVDLYATEH